MPADFPTKAIGSLGPEKTNTRAYLRPSSELSAAELEVMKDWIIALAQEIGIDDGSTPGSLWEAIGGGGPWKSSVRVAVDSGTLTSDFEDGDTVDGVAVAAGDRVAVLDSFGVLAGIRVVAASGTPARAVDFADGDSVASAVFVVREGTYAGRALRCSNASGSDVVGTHSLTFESWPPCCTDAVQATEFTPQASNPGGTPANTLYQDDGSNYESGTLVWPNKAVILDETSIGDPGTEQGSIQVNGAAFDAKLKVSTIGGSDSAGAILHRHSATYPASLALSRAKSDTASHAALADADVIGQVAFAGHDGTDYALGALIKCVVDGTVASDTMPSSLVLMVSPAGSQTPAAALTLAANKEATFGGTIVDPVIGDNVDTSKTVTFDLSAIATATQRTITMPDADLEFVKHKRDATAAPGASNDNTQGYAVGSQWIDVTGDAEYVCVDASTGAAVWRARGGSPSAASESTAGIAEIATQAEADGGSDDTRIMTAKKVAALAMRAPLVINDTGVSGYTISDANAIAFDGFAARDDWQIHQKDASGDYVTYTLGVCAPNTVIVIRVDATQGCDFVGSGITLTFDKGNSDTSAGGGSSPRILGVLYDSDGNATVTGTDP